MTPKRQPWPTKQGTQRHQPQLTCISTSSVPAVHHITSPSTPLSVVGTPRRHTRSSQQKLNVQTLPGTQWDELEIERQRERRRRRKPASHIVSTPSFSTLSLHENGTIAPSSQIVTPTNLDCSHTATQNHPPARQSQNPSIGVVEEVPSQGLITALSPAKRRRPNQQVPVKHRVPSQGRSESASEFGINIQSPSLVPDLVAEEDHPRTMARRPVRNQVDYVAEWRDAILESLSKLSDIQGKIALLGQQIAKAEEELKAKESDGSVTLEDTNILDELYRSMIKLTEQETSILDNEQDGLIHRVVVLNAHAPPEDTPAPGRGSAAFKQRAKRSGMDFEAHIDSPGPTNDVKRVKGQSQRSSSVASQTPKDGNSRSDEGPDSSRNSVVERAKMLVLHAEVAYKQSKTTHDSDGERIHCTIIGIRKDKGSGRAIYDIKDKDESENLLYTARAEDLLPIPPTGSQLASFSPGKHVIALYPGTTTFYNAQVTGLSPRRGAYSLKFEGEENEQEVKMVEGRYVLDTKAK